MLKLCSFLESFGSVTDPESEICDFSFRLCYALSVLPKSGYLNMTDGKEYTTDQLLKTALRFKVLLGDKGGITVSGGEPLLQMNFLTELFVRQRKRSPYYSWIPAEILIRLRMPWHSKWLELMKYTDLCFWISSRSMSRSM